MPAIKPPVLPAPKLAPDDALIVSYSELDTFRQCPLKHMWAYKQRWTADTGGAKGLGKLWHQVMEAHYTVIMQEQAGKPLPLSRHKTVLAAARLAVYPILWSDKGLQTDDQSLVWWMYEGHIEKYGIDPQWVILAVEYPLVEELPDPDNPEADSFYLKGKLDLVVWDVKTNKVWVIDHKSGQNLPTQFELDIDDQFGLYEWLMNRAGFKIAGTIHSANRTTRNKGDVDGPPPPNTKKQTLEQRLSRTILVRSPKTTLNIARDAWAVAMNAYPPEGMELPLYSSPDARQCGWKCDFKEVHLIARTGRDATEVLKEYGFVQDFTRH